jgi:uncharacterized protein (TIGR00369 family)
MSTPAIVTAAGLREMLHTAFPHPNGWGGPEVVDVTPDGVIVRLAVTELHGRPGGTVSGPTVMTLVDTVAYLAILSRVGPELLAVTTSLHIDFVRKPPLTDMTATASIVKLGRTLVVVDVTVHSVGVDEPVAKSLVTYARARA